MSDPLFKIPPLEWEFRDGGCKSVTPHGAYLIGFESLILVYVDKKMTTSIAQFETLEDAQASADEHNRQQMMPGLEEVT